MAQPAHTDQHARSTHTDQIAQSAQSAQSAQTDQMAQMNQMGILTQMPTEIIVQIYKSLHSFADLNALVRTSSWFHEIWLQDLSSIIKALYPTITDYMDLAEDFLLVQDLEPRPAVFSYVTYEKIYWTRILRFVLRQRELIASHCDMIDDTPVADVLRKLDITKGRLDSYLAELSPEALVKEETVTIMKRSLVNICLILHTSRLLATEKKMRMYCEIFRQEMKDCFRKAVPLHPKDLTVEETDRFMKAAYRVAILGTSNKWKERTLAQAFNATVLIRLLPDEESQLHNVSDWLLFVRYSNSEEEATIVAKQRRREILYKNSQCEKWKSTMRAGGIYAPCYFNTKRMMQSMMEQEWVLTMDEGCPGNEAFYSDSDEMTDYDEIVEEDDEDDDPNNEQDDDPYDEPYDENEWDEETEEGKSEEDEPGEEEYNGDDESELQKLQAQHSHGSGGAKEEMVIEGEKDDEVRKTEPTHT